MPKKFDPAIIEKAIAAVHGGMSVQDAAPEFGVSVPALYRWVKNSPVAVTKVAPKAAATPATKAPKAPAASVFEDNVVVLREHDINSASAESSDAAVLRRKAIGFDPKVPDVMDGFVPFGQYKSVLTLIKSGKLLPTVITGESGTGKSMLVNQACAEAKRPVIFVSCHFAMTDSDLFGKFTLINGNTVWEDGPVVIAMKSGAILVLDEVDRANPEIMTTLHMILDGYQYTSPMTGETISPAAGFQVFATANTKGQGDGTDRYITAKVMDEAFLERFPIVLEQTYPVSSVEEKIIYKKVEKTEKTAPFVESLVKWANVTRNTYKAGGIGNYITTRRLSFIAEIYVLTENEAQSVEWAINRFDAELRDSLLELFKAIHAGEYKDADATATNNQPAEY